MRDVHWLLLCIITKLYSFIELISIHWVKSIHWRHTLLINQPYSLNSNHIQNLPYLLNHVHPMKTPWGVLSIPGRGETSLWTPIIFWESGLAKRVLLILALGVNVSTHCHKTSTLSFNEPLLALMWELRNYSPQIPTLMAYWAWHWWANVLRLLCIIL